MNVNDINSWSNIFKGGFLISIAMTAVFMAQNAALIGEPLIASAIAFDLIITLPVAYWFFIRKTKISRLTVAEVFLLGIVLASFILPAENRQLLDYFKQFAVPTVELGFLAYAGYIIRRARKKYQSLDRNGKDFLEKLRETLAAEFPSKLLAKAVTFEIAGIYYAVFSWKTKRGAKTYTYHKQNGVAALLVVFAFLAAVEILVTHLLVAQWSAVAAWILTAFGAYFLFQLSAHGKAVFLRPIEIVGNKLFVRCGLLGDVEIDTSDIASIGVSATGFQLENHETKLAPLGGFTPCNLKISLKNDAVLNAAYGRRKSFKTIFLSVDEAEIFKAEIEKMR